MPKTVDVAASLELRGYIELPRHEDTTIAELIEILKQFDPSLPVCGQGFNHGTADLRIIAPESRCIDDEDGTRRQQNILHLGF